MCDYSNRQMESLQVIWLGVVYCIGVNYVLDWKTN